MSLRIRLIIVLVCIGIGIAPQPSWAESHYRLAKTYADKNDVARASVYYGLALKNAAPKQVAGIASDYAAFLSETGDLRKAELILRQALTQSPHSEELIRMLARCLVRQEKVVEGLRYFKSVCSETEAREEIAAIYREQGNSDMLLAIEQKWGSAKQGPVLVATGPKPASALSTKVATPNPDSATVAPKPLVATATPVAPSSKAEMFDTKIPIPVPAPLPVAASSPRPAPAPTLPSSQWATIASLSKPAPLPVATLTAMEKRTLVLEKTVELSAAPQPVLSERYLPKSEVVPQPRKHYVVNAASSADLDALFPVKPVAATVPTIRER